VLVVAAGRVLDRPRHAALLTAAGALFAVSMALDLIEPRIALRRSAEELPKVWGGVLVMAFAWLRVEDAVDSLAFPGVHGALLAWGRRAAERPRPDGGRRPAPDAPGTPAPARPARRDGRGAPGVPKERGARSKSGRP
jgi:hypothetical protein